MLGAAGNRESAEHRLPLRMPMPMLTSLAATTTPHWAPDRAIIVRLPLARRVDRPSIVDRDHGGAIVRLALASPPRRLYIHTYMHASHAPMVTRVVANTHRLEQGLPAPVTAVAVSPSRRIRNIPHLSSCSCHFPGPRRRGRTLNNVDPADLQPQAHDG